MLQTIPATSFSRALESRRLHDPEGGASATGVSISANLAAFLFALWTGLHFGTAPFTGARHAAFFFRLGAGVYGTSSSVAVFLDLLFAPFSEGSFNSSGSSCAKGG